MPLALACSTAAGRRDTVIEIADTLSGPFLFSESGTITSLQIDPDNWVLKDLSYPAPNLNTVVKGLYKLTLHWNRFAADPDTPAGYNIFRAEAYAGPYLRINQTVHPDTVYTDSGLAAGVPYFYRVSAVCRADTCFESRLSNIRGGIPNGVAAGAVQEPEAAELSLQISGSNPARETVGLDFFLPSPGRARLAVYNLSGQMVRVIVDGERQAGRHTAVWNGRDSRGRRAASGVYLVNLEWNGRRVSARVERVR